MSKKVSERKNRGAYFYGYETIKTLSVLYPPSFPLSLPIEVNMQISDAPLRIVFASWRPSPLDLVHFFLL